MKVKRKRKGNAATVRTWPPASIGAYAGEYCEWLLARNYSADTVHIRRHYLTVFADWCAERGIAEPCEVTKPVVERYQKWLFHYRKKNGELLSFRGQHSQLVPVRTFFKWLARQNHILYNPASDIELPRLSKRLPRNVLTAAEAEAVLATVDITEPMGVRNRAMLETFYSTGMRRKELMNLLVYDISFEQGTIFIREGKGKRDRVIPIGERALAWVRKYLYEERPKLVMMPDSGHLFLSDQGEQLSSTRLTEIVRECVDAANLGKKGSCHLFRHTCATLMLEGGADIRFIQQQLGHAELSTTEIYTQVAITKLKAIHTATHPAAKLEKHTEKPHTSGEKPPETAAGAPS
jgi:integrase/recombinase XerD